MIWSLGIWFFASNKEKQLFPLRSLKKKKTIHNSISQTNYKINITPLHFPFKTNKSLMKWHFTVKKMYSLTVHYKSSLADQRLWIAHCFRNRWMLINGAKCTNSVKWPLWPIVSIYALLYQLIVHLPQILQMV